MAMFSLCWSVLTKVSPILFTFSTAKQDIELQIMFTMYKQICYYCITWKLTPNFLPCWAWDVKNPHQRLLLLMCHSRDISAEGNCTALQNEALYPGNPGKTPDNSKHFGEDPREPKASKFFCLGRGNLWKKREKHSPLWIQKGFFWCLDEKPVWEDTRHAKMEQNISQVSGAV